MCESTWLREPVIGDYMSMLNALLPLSIDLWANDAETQPDDLTNYTARGALKHPETLAVTNLTSAVITQTSTLCNITGKLAKATVEGLLANVAYIFDLSVDNAVTGDSFVVWTGTITFRLGASS